MVVKYSSLNRFETPNITLCNPGSVYTPNVYGSTDDNNSGTLTKVVGMLVDVSDMEIVFNFNSTSELNFRVNKVEREREGDNTYVHNIYKSIQNRRLLFVDGIGYFSIMSIEEGYENGIHFKDVNAQSIDVEIQQKMIPYIENGTYRFSPEDVESTGLINTIVDAIPLWTIGTIDQSVASKYRTFEDVDTSINCLSFMIDNMQDAYECIFIFDIVNRKINVYDQNNYVKQTSVHLTKNDVINSLNISENADDLYTALSVLGGDNITISAVNPLGTNTIYNFSYYLSWMSNGLRRRVETWMSDIDSYKEDYYDLNLEYYSAMEEASSYEMELQKLDIQYKMYSRCRDNIVAESNTGLVNNYNTVIVENGGAPIIISDEIEETLNDIDDRIAEVQSSIDAYNELLRESKAELETIKSNISDIHDTLNMAEYFSSGELEELMNYVFEGSYTDEYIVITDVMSYEEKFEQMKTLYDRAESRLERVSTPTQEFNIDVENFIFEREFEHWSEQLETGCLINVELDVNDVADLFLSNITINYEDHDLSMTFGNRFNKFDPRSLFDDVLGSVSKSANTIDYIKEILFPIKNGEFNAVKDALQNSRNISMGNALASTDEDVVIDGSGFTSRRKLDNGGFDPKQVKINGKNIVFTDDAWETAKVAIGELNFGDGQSAYGINAETVVGDLIMGNELRILDKNGQPLMDVIDGKISLSVGGDGDDSFSKRISVLEATSDGLDYRVGQIEEDDTASGVKTKVTEYKFDDDGLYIGKSGEEISNVIDNTGMFVRRTNGGETVDVLTADTAGVNALNLTARQYLIVGSYSRFEDYIDNDEQRTGCFHIVPQESETEE